MFEIIQIIIFIVILGILILPFSVVKASDKTRYIVYLCILGGLVVMIFITQSYNFLLIAAIIIIGVRIGRKLKQLK